MVNRLPCASSLVPLTTLFLPLLPVYSGPGNGINATFQTGMKVNMIQALQRSSHVLLKKTEVAINNKSALSKDEAGRRFNHHCESVGVAWS